MKNNVVALRGRPLHNAYAYAEMAEHCPNCQSPAGDYCRRPDGCYRRIPCIARAKPQASQTPTTGRPTLTVAK
jgi:hypothetical protein